MTTRNALTPYLERAYATLERHRKEGGWSRDATVGSISEDLSGEMFAVQVKSGGAFSERYWSWLKAVPVNAGQTPLLVVTDAPGPGHARRAVVVLDITEWVALHGPTGGTE
jgi:hypothetical protein